MGPEPKGRDTLLHLGHRLDDSATWLGQVYPLVVSGLVAGMLHDPLMFGIVISPSDTRDLFLTACRERGEGNEPVHRISSSAASRDMFKMRHNGFISSKFGWRERFADFGEPIRLQTIMASSDSLASSSKPHAGRAIVTTADR